MTKSTLKVLALACAALGMGYTPAQANDEVNLEVSSYEESNLPQDIYEEMGTLTLSDDIIARGNGGNGGGKGGNGGNGGKGGRDGRGGKDGKKGGKHDGRRPDWRGNDGRGPDCRWPRTCFEPIVAEEASLDGLFTEELDARRGGDRGGRDGVRDGRRGDRGRDHGRWDGRHPHRRPHWDRGRGGDRIIIRPAPHRGHNACFAKNGRGIVFRAAGYAPRRQLQNVAMRKCMNNSGNPNSCRPLGCR